MDLGADNAGMATTHPPEWYVDQMGFWSQDETPDDRARDFQAGFDLSLLESRTLGGRTALCSAAAHDALAIAAWLLERGALARVMDDDGNTPVTLSLGGERWRAWVELWRRHGVDLGPWRSDDGRSADRFPDVEEDEDKIGFALANGYLARGMPALHRTLVRCLLRGNARGAARLAAEGADLTAGCADPQLAGDNDPMASLAVRAHPSVIAWLLAAGWTEERLRAAMDEGLHRDWKAGRGHLRTLADVRAVAAEGRARLAAACAGPDPGEPGAGAIPIADPEATAEDLHLVEQPSIFTADAATYHRHAAALWAVLSGNPGSGQVRSIEPEGTRTYQARPVTLKPDLGSHRICCADAYAGWRDARPMAFGPARTSTHPVVGLQGILVEDADRKRSFLVAFAMREMEWRGALRWRTLEREQAWEDTGVVFPADATDAYHRLVQTGLYLNGYLQGATGGLAQPVRMSDGGDAVLLARGGGDAVVRLSSGVDRDGWVRAVIIDLGYVDASP